MSNVHNAALPQRLFFNCLLVLEQQCSALVKSDSSLTTASLPLLLVETFLRKGWKTLWPRALALPQEESVSSLSCSRVENLRCQGALRNESSRHSLTEKCETLVVACPRQASKTNPFETF